MKNIISYSILLLVFLTTSAGLAQKNNFEKGSIILSKKKSIDAYILIDFTQPQNFQKQITYLEPKGYEKFKGGTKLKKVQETLKSKDILGFELEDGRKFKSVKYMDLTKKGMGMMPKKFCLEQISDGKIDMFKFYQHTGSTGSVGISKISYELQDVIRESNKNGDQVLIDYIQGHFQLLAQKEHKTPKNIYNMNMLNLIGDNAEVKENYDNNHYGVQAYITGDIKPGLLAHPMIEAAFLKMTADYNGGTQPTK